MSESKADIHALPRWQKVARAAANARAVLHKFTEHWPGADPSHVRNLEAAAAFAENAALNERCDCLSAAEMALRAEKVAFDAVAPANLEALGMAESIAASRVAHAVAKAVRAASSAAAAVVAQRPEHAEIADAAVTEHVLLGEGYAAKAAP